MIILGLNINYFKVYIHGAEEIIDIGTELVMTNSEDGTFIQVYLSVSSSLFTSDAAKKLNVQQRNCRLINESNLKHSPVYSYTLCRNECRIQLSLKICKCIPHFYRPRGTYC